MTKVIDLKMDIPETPEDRAKEIDVLVANEEGTANYRRIFGPQIEANLGVKLEELENKRKELGLKKYMEYLVEKTKKLTITFEQFMSGIDSAGIEWCLIDDPDNEKTLAFIQKDTKRLKGSVTVDPFKGQSGVMEIERLHKEHDFKAIYVSPFLSAIKANDARFYPFYAKAVELDIPAFVYTNMPYNLDLPIDVARPINLDRVALDFPKLRIVISCGGWPWIHEVVGLARRHPNIHVDFSSHRPKYLGVQGSGFGMLLQYGNTLMQNQVVFGSGVGDLGLPIETIVNEVKELPLKDKVKEKWLYKNALRLFKMS